MFASKLLHLYGCAECPKPCKFQQCLLLQLAVGGNQLAQYPRDNGGDPSNASSGVEHRRPTLWHQDQNQQTIASRDLMHRPANKGFQITTDMNLCTLTIDEI